MCKACVDESRRKFLRRSAAGLAAAGMFGLTGAQAFSASVPATSLTPDEALAKLKQGNATFMSAPELCSHEIAHRREQIAQGQAPWATVLACADSRVNPEMIFGGLDLGELFVCRNAGNMADTATMGTIEYGAAKLGSPLVVVLGHDKCGAVAAACDVAVKGTDLPGFIAPMVDAILPSAIAMRDKAGDFVHNTVIESARRTAQRIGRTSEIVSDLADQGKVKIVYAVYSLDTGKVDFLG